VLLHGTIDLNPGATKNKDARVIKMTQEVRAIISMCIAVKNPEDRVFTREKWKANRRFSENVIQDVLRCRTRQDGMSRL
jgi:hypothetical protein